MYWSPESPPDLSIHGPFVTIHAFGQFILLMRTEAHHEITKFLAFSSLFLCSLSTLPRTCKARDIHWKEKLFKCKFMLMRKVRGAGKQESFNYNWCVLDISPHSFSQQCPSSTVGKWQKHLVQWPTNSGLQQTHGTVIPSWVQILMLPFSCYVTLLLPSLQLSKTWISLTRIKGNGYCISLVQHGKT